MSKKTDGVKKSYKSRHGSERKRFFHKSKGPAASARRKSALERLETQLKLNSKLSKVTGSVVPLTEQDIKRIQKEIETLKSRL